MTEIEFYKAMVRDVRAGHNVKIVEPANVYECDLSDNVFIGPFCEIQKGRTMARKDGVMKEPFGVR